MEVMEVKDQLGSTAGEVWRQLSQGGPQTLTQLRKKLNGQSDLVNFAVGWLAREDKVSIVADKRSFLVQLK
ncbi:MAG: winged helix-turn-helix domain-containing protein [Terriglobia bacterium]